MYTVYTVYIYIQHLSFQRFVNIISGGKPSEWSKVIPHRFYRTVPKRPGNKKTHVCLQLPSSTN